MLEDIGIAMPEDIVVTHPRAGIAVVALKGEHDLKTRDEVATMFSGLIATNKLVIVDASEALFIDSSFLSNLLLADNDAKVRGTRFVLEMGTASIVRKALEVTGTLERLDSVTSREEALAQLERNPTAH